MSKSLLEKEPGHEIVRVIEFGHEKSREFAVQVGRAMLRDFPTMTLVEAVLVEVGERLSEEQILVLQASGGLAAAASIVPAKFFTKCWLFLVMPSTENGILGYLCYLPPR